MLVPFLRALGGGRSLVVAGSAASPYAQEILRLARAEGVAERVLLPGNVTDAEKYWLLANAEAFVFPSLAEGFGLPVVEAMSLGKPVFLSTRTSLPETGGPEAFYWPDFDPRAMAEVFTRGMARAPRRPGEAGAAARLGGPLQLGARRARVPAAVRGARRRAGHPRGAASRRSFSYLSQVAYADSRHTSHPARPSRNPSFRT